MDYSLRYDTITLGLSIVYIEMLQVNSFHSGKQALANSEDQNESRHKSAFHQGLHSLWIIYNPQVQDKHTL